MIPRQRSLDGWLMKPEKRQKICANEVDGVPQIAVRNAEELVMYTETPPTEEKERNNSKHHISIATLIENSIESSKQPYHCDPKFLPSQILKNKTLTFQNSWFQRFPWLHCIENYGVVCYFCAKVHKRSPNILSKYRESSFIVSVFSNWKKAIEKFRIHELSNGHKCTVSHIEHTSKTAPIESLLSSKVNQQQSLARTCLLKIISSLKYLSRQGLAARGHRHDEGNFIKLLELRSSDVPDLQEWMCRKRKFVNWEIQNEIFEMFSYNIIHQICLKVNTQAYSAYSMIVDGTQDISGKEQYSICIRYVDETMKPKEEFIGFYIAEETTGRKLAEIIIDALCRLQMPLSNLRGQTYDGAANMSGEYRGTQAILRQKQPLALYVHCGAHCTNLVLEAVCISCPAIKSSLELVNEIGVLFGQSGKFKQIFESIAKCNAGSYTTLKPLCPTRWTARLEAVQAILTQYESVLNALEEMADNHQARASGLLERLTKGSTVVGLCFAEEVMRPLQVLNKALQSSHQTVSGMIKSVDLTVATMERKRNENSFEVVFGRAKRLIDVLELDPLQLPRYRNPPKRYSGPVKNYKAGSPEEHYRMQYFQAIDTARLQLRERFQQKGMLEYQHLEESLLTGIANDSLNAYPEFDKGLMSAQLSMFKEHYEYSTTTEAVKIISDMSPEVKILFNEVVQLARLLLTVPASTCEAERSFSALRRLKTYLRNSMSQRRLNALAVCHVHQELLDEVDITDVAETFIQKNKDRHFIFGKF